MSETVKGCVLSLCDYTGNMVKPWLYAGHECWIVDLAHPSGENISGKLVTVGADILNWTPPNCDWAFCAAFPPCTDLAVSGSRHFKSKGLRKLAAAIDLFGRCVELLEEIGAPYIIENPVSTISTYYRKPDYVFDPCDYGDVYRKKTCLWAGGGFVMPPKSEEFLILEDFIHTMSESKDRARRRSVTPMGFAQAVYDSNKE